LTPQAGEEFLQSTLAHLDAVHALDPAAGARARRGPGPGAGAQGVRRRTGGTPPRDPRAWLVTICLNTARSWYRRDAAGLELLTSDPAATLAGAVDPAADAIGRVRAEAVHKALWTLPEVQRVAITLMDLSGFTAQEVAGLTGAPRGTVLSRVHRGRKALAAALHAHAPDRPTVRTERSDDRP